MTQNNSRAGGRAATAKPVAGAPVSQPTRKNATVVRQTPNGSFGGVSDAAVKDATGRGWSEWLVVLDQAGAAEMPHKDIAALLLEQHDQSPWWSQMVTVGYEQARGLREKHQTPQGYQISASRTINVGIDALYASWADESQRNHWLPEADMAVRTATSNKSMRITWDASKPDIASSLEVNFYAKGESKSQVALGHTKLRTGAEGEKWKQFWSERLDGLKQMLER